MGQQHNSVKCGTTTPLAASGKVNQNRGKSIKEILEFVTPVL
jgi:hypothetical protein